MAGESLHKSNTVSISMYNDNTGDSICVHLYPSVANKLKAEHGVAFGEAVLSFQTLPSRSQI